MTKTSDPKKFSEELKKKKPEDEDDDSSGWMEDNTDSDGEPNFIKKDEPQEELEEKNEHLQEVVEEAAQEVQGIIDKLKNLIFPKNNQQRNLTRETGGLESEEKKEISTKDAWDDRSEEVDKMGSTDTFNTTGMKSVVWKQKRDRLRAKKEAKEQLRDAAEAGAAMASKKQRNSLTSQAGDSQTGYAERLKNLRQDRSGINDGKGGGAWR